MSEGSGPVEEPAGITELIDGLVRQNLGRDPSRRLRRRDVVAIEAVDAGVAVSVRSSDGTILGTDGRDRDARVVVTAPLRFGLPDAFSRDGRALIRDLLTRRIRVRGLIRYLGMVRRLMSLLSAR